jgi:hypothetical protein
MPVNGEIQRRLREYETPQWGYRRGKDGGVEKDLFDGTLPKGWFDSPARVDGADDDKPSDPEPVNAPEPADNRIEAVTPPYDDRYGFHHLRLEMQRRTGKGPVPGTTRVDLIKALEALDTAP